MAEEKNTPSVESSSSDPDDPGYKLAFIGLHGGVFDVLKRYEADFPFQLEYLEDDQLGNPETDFSQYAIVFLQHARAEDRDHYRRLIKEGRQQNPSLKIISISGLAERHLPQLTSSGVIEQDDTLSSYYGSSSENLRRMLIYVGIKYLNQTGNILPPEVQQKGAGIYHPAHDGFFEKTEQFLAWAREQNLPTENIPRVLIAVHSTHLEFQQPDVVKALIATCEQRGALAVAMLDYGPQYEQNVLAFKPDIIVHTCHSRESVDFREKVGVPHVHSIFFRKQSISEWKSNNEGLAANEMAFQIVGQELLGAIEPQVGSGTKAGGGSSEAFQPIPERIEHLVDRSLAWVNLAYKENSEKKIAFFYYNREMGKAELMRGSATGMFMNGPRSLVALLKEMNIAGYELGHIPADEDELVSWMQKQGQQIGIWAPGNLDRLARSGDAVLVPAETYQAWFEEKVPEKSRETLIQRWGAPPGKLLVWTSEEGKQFIVIPKISLGKSILLPQPLRGEAHDTSLLHDKLVPPPHNYLATYFWLQEEYGADAIVHFGTHGSEFMLPGKPTGLSHADWPDLLMGHLPNINPWVINNLGESSPVRRRAYALLIDHLVPPSVNAELSDELLNLHNDIDKWVVLEEGALREKFRESITRQFLDEHLDQDLKIDLSQGRLLEAEEIEAVLEYLHDIHNETTPISLHQFGQVPPDELQISWIVTSLRKEFRDVLGEVINVPMEEAINPGDRQKYLRRKAEEIMNMVLVQGFTIEEAIESVGGRIPETGLPEKLQQGVELAAELRNGFQRTDDELKNFLAALSGRFISPGPGNAPDRNPGVLPTGRNMYVMNPEEVPTRPSWEIGKQLVDQLLKQHREKQGAYPRKIAFTLNSFATFQDYGVMESQILYLMGARPVWDSNNLVVDVELIPQAELGRPRIDVFISALGYYRDMLPTRMKLLDKAIRLVAETEEEANYLFQNSQQAYQEFLKKGIEDNSAKRLSQARIFGGPPGQFGSAGYYYLVERSGEWDTREDLMETYLSFSRHVYTEGAWGEDAPDIYDRHIQGTEILLRSWSDRTRSPLSNKYDWYKGGSLSLAIKHLTGKEPEWFLSDVRDPDNASMVDAEAALRQDYRVRLFNRKWIEGMMKEGYAGADQISVHVSNTLGWKIMRENSVSEDIWEEIVDVYIRDKKNLHIREWFEAENPFAYQEMNEILLETVRKGYWQPGEETLREIAVEYARSVARHGEGGGLRGGGNVKLESFVEEILTGPGDPQLAELFAQYDEKSRETQEVDSSPANTLLTSAEIEAVPDSDMQTNEPIEQKENSTSEQTASQTEMVEGRELVPQDNETKNRENEKQVQEWLSVSALILFVALLLVLLGYLRHGKNHSK